MMDVQPRRWTCPAVAEVGRRIAAAAGVRTAADPGIGEGMAGIAAEEAPVLAG